MSITAPQSYRAALDLLACRQQHEYETFEQILADMCQNPGPAVVATYAVTTFALAQVSHLDQAPVQHVLGTLRIEAVPAAAAAVPDVFTTLYASTEDQQTATVLARSLGSTPRAEAAMVVFTDISVAMTQRVARFAGLPDSTVLAAWRQQAEHRIAGATPRF
jgi:hypothetical protein